MESLIKSLKELKKKYGIIGVKQSFEDEGASYDDVMIMRHITTAAGVELGVKIGGCEARTDLNKCLSMGVDRIVAPMVETPFALSKFTDQIKNIEELPRPKFYVNIETKTAYENFEDIISHEGAKHLSGFIIGRSDFSKSYGMMKSQVNNNGLHEKIVDILEIVKYSRGRYETLMGGNMTADSIGMVRSLHNQCLLDMIETRAIMIRLTDHVMSCLPDVINDSLKFEVLWLEYKMEREKEWATRKEYEDRISSIKSRINDII